MPAPGLFTLTGKDTLTINGLVFNGLMDGSNVDITFPNNIANAKIGKNANAIIAENKTGLVADVKLRVLMNSAEDKFLLNLMNSQLNNFTGFATMTGSFTKNLGDGAGNLSHRSYNLAGGFFQKMTPLTSNAEGQTDQAVSMYELQFTSATPAID